MGNKLYAITIGGRYVEIVLSPDGNWLWTGEEWVPTPPKASPNAVENAIEEIEEIAEQNNISVQELKYTHF